VVSSISKIELIRFCITRIIQIAKDAERFEPYHSHTLAFHFSLTREELAEALGESQGCQHTSSTRVALDGLASSKVSGRKAGSAATQEEKGEHGTGSTCQCLVAFCGILWYFVGSALQEKYGGALA